MKTTSFIGMAAAVIAMGLSTACFAWGRGGGGAAFHAGGHGWTHMAAGSSHAWGGMRMAHSVPPVSGVWHVRGGSSYFTGFGHTNTAFHGHTNTAFVQRIDGRERFGQSRDFARTRPPFVRYAYSPFSRSRYGRGVPGALGAGSYGGDVNAAPGYFAGDTGGQSSGYAEAPLAATYGEPPVGQSSYADAEAQFLGFGGYQGGYAGGPQVIVVNNVGTAGPSRASGCSCARSAAMSPVVYRFGVGSYY